MTDFTLSTKCPWARAQNVILRQPLQVSRSWPPRVTTLWVIVSQVFVPGHRFFQAHSVAYLSESSIVFLPSSTLG